MINGYFGNVSAGVLFSKVAYQRKRWQRSWDSTRKDDFMKGPSEELKGQIIDKILEAGGDRILGYFPAK